MIQGSYAGGPLFSAPSSGFFVTSSIRAERSSETPGGSRFFPACADYSRVANLSSGIDADRDHLFRRPVPFKGDVPVLGRTFLRNFIQSPENFLDSDVGHALCASLGFSAGSIGKNFLPADFFHTW